MPNPYAPTAVDESSDDSVLLKYGLWLAWFGVMLVVIAIVEGSL